MQANGLSLHYFFNNYRLSFVQVKQNQHTNEQPINNRMMSVITSTEVLLMIFTRLNRFIITLSLNLLVFGNVAYAINNVDVTQVNDYHKSLSATDKAHQAFANTFYAQLANSPAIQAKRFNTIEKLTSAVNKAVTSQNQVSAVALIIRNHFLLSRYYDSAETITLVKLLLDNNHLIAANKLIDEINQQGDDSVTGQLNYLLADFYFQREQWLTVLEYLEGNSTDLPLAQYHHALLMTGVALQKQAKHDLAIKVYEKIPEQASNYTTAQLNLAIANIRQGWWTDGHQIISQLVAKPEIAQQERTLNRLYITLGYSLLNQAYYRNARKAFQRVALDSHYSNQALLGIALTAAHQDDYLGAINASRFLKEKKQDDLPIDEAFLLMPFFYEKTQQRATASLGYSQAAQYYQDKTVRLTTLINAPINLTQSTVQFSPRIHINLADSHIDLQKNYPEYFFNQRQNTLQLLAWQAKSNNSKLASSLTKLAEQYDALTIKMAKSIMQARVAQLTSYLNQSRYGLARLYDNNTVEQ